MASVCNMGALLRYVVVITLLRKLHVNTITTDHASIFPGKVNR